MSATSNTDSLAAKNEEFRSRVPPSEPLTTKGHAPGVKVGNDAVPEYSAETFPPGTAPSEHTHQPNPDDQVPGGRGPLDGSSTGTSKDPLDMPGATSQSVHKGLGKPVHGQEEGNLKGKKEPSGLTGVGASTGTDSVREKGADLPEGVVKGTRGKASEGYPSANERVPVSAETLAAERD